MSEGPTIGDWTQYGWIPDDASFFPARVRLRNAAWMVYYEPDTVAQRERAERLKLQAENAKLRELAKGYEALTATLCNERGCDGCPFDDPERIVCEHMRLQTCLSELEVEVSK